MSLPEAIFLSFAIICFTWAVVEVFIWRQNNHWKSLAGVISGNTNTLNTILHEIRKISSPQKQKQIKAKIKRGKR
jgi:ABC-type iron transport system FetAB permease component